MDACEYNRPAGADKLTTSLSLGRWRGQIRSAIEKCGEIPDPGDDRRLEGQNPGGVAL